MIVTQSMRKVESQRVRLEVAVSFWFLIVILILLLILIFPPTCYSWVGLL